MRRLKNARQKGSDTKAHNTKERKTNGCKTKEWNICG